MTAIYNREFGKQLNNSTRRGQLPFAKAYGLTKGMEVTDKNFKLL